MPCTIVSNNIPSPSLREAVSQAICEGIGDKPGNWEIIVYQALDYAGVAIRITGPEKLRWNWTFFGDEQAPDFIRDRVAKSITGQQSLQTEHADADEPEDSSEEADPTESLD